MKTLALIAAIMFISVSCPRHPYEGTRFLAYSYDGDACALGLTEKSGDGVMDTPVEIKAHGTARQPSAAIRNTGGKAPVPSLPQDSSQNRRERTVIIAIIAAIVILALVCASVILFMRNRMLTYKRELERRRISDLIDTQNRMAEHIDVLEHDLSAEMHSNNQILSSPQLITGKDEGKFRRAFNVIYPDFITRLKKDYPALSTNDELLCMLLYLRHTSEEISIYLGISRASVNSARYRLRTKFKLPKTVELDSFILSR